MKQEHRRLKEEVETKLADAQARQAQAYDKGVREGYYAAGDLVYLYSPAVNSKKGLSQKLHCPYTGPFRVIQKAGEVNYDIISCRPRGGKPKGTHQQVETIFSATSIGHQGDSPIVSQQRN